MADFTRHILDAFEAEGLDVAELRKAQRVVKVRNLWSKLVEESILDHTNGVYIFHNNDQLEMHVYMDSSLFASEVSNRRALIQEECRIKYHEPIDDVYVHVSQGQKRLLYPFRTTGNETVDGNPAIALNEDELARVEKVCASIEDQDLRHAFKQAMISDLEWKKGNQ